jgi:hypothetical protein
MNETLARASDAAMTHHRGKHFCGARAPRRAHFARERGEVFEVNVLDFPVAEDLGNDRLGGGTG